MNTSDTVTFGTYPHTEQLKIAVEHTRAATQTHDESTPHVMFCGGFHSTMQGTKAAALKAHCQQNGWHYTRFDYRGHGQSDGEPAGFTLQDWLEDTLAVLADYPQPTLLVGSSMGAWLASLAALQQPGSVCALLLIAAAPDFVQRLVTPLLTPTDVWDLQQGQTVNLPTKYESPHPVTQALLDGAAGLSLLDSDALGSLSCPVRLVHGTADIDVPYDLATQYLTKLPESHDARLTLLHNTDHRLSDDRSLSYIKHELSMLVDHVS